MSSNYFLIRRLLQTPFQLVVFTILKVLLWPFIKTTNIPKDIMPARGANLIVANHRHMTDAFVMYASLPYPSLVRATPIGVMLADRFYDSFVRPLVWLLGCFPARNKRENHKFYGVDAGVQMLQNGFNLCIFPHGRTVKPGKEADAKVYPGVIQIHQAVPNIPIILCHIEYTPGLKAWFTRKKVTIVFKRIGKTMYATAESIVDDIYAL